MSATAETLAFETGMRMRRGVDLTRPGGYQFLAAVRSFAAAKGNVYAWSQTLENSSASSRVAALAKGLATATTDWTGPDGAILSGQFLEEIAPRSILDSMLRWAKPIPLDVANLRIITGASASIVGEAQQKLSTVVTGMPANAPWAKAVAVTVVSDDLLKFGDASADKLFNRELERAILKATNAHVIQSFTKTTVAAGATAQESLAIGLKAAPESDGYVVAAPPDLAIELASGADGRMGVRGGEIMPGVQVIAVTGLTTMLVIPASRFMVSDGGLSARVSDQALVQVENAGSGAAATATVGSGAVTSIAVTNGGSAYQIPPVVVLTGGGGSGASASAVLNAEGEITAINVASPGSGYSSAPTVSFVTQGTLSLWQENLTGFLVERYFRSIQGAEVIEVA